MKPPLWFRATRFVLVTAGWLVLLVSFGTLGLLLHIDLPAGRAVTAKLIEEFLSGYFQGTIDVRGLRSVTVRGIRVDTVSVYDTYGNRVLVLKGLRARASLQQIAQKVLSNEQKLSIVISHVRVEAADHLQR